jgi:DcmR-like sensory protein/putative zinc finger protein
MKPGRSELCRRIGALTSAYLDGSLSETERSEVEAHVRACATCSRSLDELRWVARTAGSLGRATPAGPVPEYTAAVDELRRHASSGPRVRLAHLPLGIGEQAAAFGDHIAFPWESEHEFLSTAGFLAHGLDRGEACVLVGHDRANRRVLTNLESLGLNARQLQREKRLHVAPPGTSADAILGDLDERVKDTVGRGVIGVRVLGNLGWGAVDPPVDEELLRLEARVTDAVRLYPIVVLCAYEIASVPPRGLRDGCFACHPWVLEHGALRSNDAYVPSERFLADLRPGRDG